MEPGLTLRFGAIEFTAESIKGFARDFDPQDFHLSEEAGRATHFGGLSASGWQIASNWMRAITLFWAAEAKAGASCRGSARRRLPGPSLAAPGARGRPDHLWIALHRGAKIGVEAGLGHRAAPEFRHKPAG